MVCEALSGGGVVGLLAAMFALVAAAEPWSEVEPGIARLHRTTSAPLSIHAVQVDLCDPSLEVRATRPSEGQRRTSAWGALVDARVAINGDFYNTSTFQTVGLAMGAGAHWPGTSDTVGWGLIAGGRDGRVEVRPPGTSLGAAPEPWMRDIVGGNPACLEGGTPRSSSASHHAQLHPRSGVGISADGRTLTLVVVDGRWPGGSVGATTRTVGEILYDLGAEVGLNLDGGGSSTLWLADHGVVNRPSGGSERTVANHLGVVRIPVPAGEPSRCCRPAAVHGANGAFEDVSDGHWAFGAIEAVADAGVTRGCQSDPPFFCPSCRGTRAAAVAFLVRATDHDLTPPVTPTFSDVPTTHPLFAEIETAARIGMTAGCGGGRFCPDDPASRATAAIFAARALGLSTPAPDAEPFSDVPASHAAAGPIAALVAACVVGGCGPDTFCPDRTVTRAELAALAARAGGLVPTGCEVGEAPDDWSEPLPDTDAPDTDDPDADPPDTDALDTATAPPSQDDALLGCGCATSPSGGPAWAFVLLVLVARRRLAPPRTG